MSWKYCVMRNMTPNIDKKIRIMPPVPVLNAGLLEEAHVEHGLVDVQFPPDEREQHDGGDRERGRASSELVQPLSGASIKP